jgi:hypothetical protein
MSSKQGNTQTLPANNKQDHEIAFIKQHNTSNHAQRTQLKMTGARRRRGDNDGGRTNTETKTKGLHDTERPDMTINII